MILIRIKGGIGNQLFIYAASRRLAIKNNTEVILDDESGFAYDKDYKRNYQLDHFKIPFRKAKPKERLEPLSRVRRYLKRAWNKKLPIYQRNYICEEGRNFHIQLLDLTIKGNVYLEGYFQSENFFSDVEAVIRQDLSMITPNDNENLAMLKKIQDKIAVAVHIRFFDEDVAKHSKTLQQETNTLNDYYKRAIIKMNDYVSNAHYFVFSNNIERVNGFLPLSNDQMTIIDHNNIGNMAYADLWLMSHCQHFVIAKSTFSWWGAWLSNYKNKIIIAPKIEKGNDYWNNDSLLPKNWIQL